MRKMKIFIPFFFSLFFFIHTSSGSSCQCLETPIQSIDTFDLGGSIGVNYIFDGKAAPNFSVSFGLGISKKINRAISNRLGEWAIIPAYQMNTNIYKNGIGNSIHRNRRKYQIDFVNSLSLTVGYKEFGKNNSSTENITFNPMTTPSVRYSDYEVSTTIATNFIINNNNRNQQIGFIGLNLWDFIRAGYYNDGPFFDKIGFGDSYDRWWTGGGFIELNTEVFLRGFYLFSKHYKYPKQYCYLCSLKFVISYDRFTGNVQDAYRVASKLGLSKVPPASEDESLFNRGFLRFALKHEDGWEIQKSILAPNDDPQDRIHDLLDISKHFSAAKKEKLFGFKLDFFILSQKFSNESK